MLTYNAYTFESKLETLFEFNDTVNDELVWNHVKEFIPDTEKSFWNKLNSLPKSTKHLLAKLLNKTFSLLKTITTDQANKLLIKLLKIVDNVVKEPVLKKKINYIIIFFILSTTTITVSSFDIGNLMNPEMEDVIKHIEPIKASAIDVKDHLPDSIPNRLKPYEDFLEELAFKESTNNWKSIRYKVKKDGTKIPVYCGKYQFGNVAFRDIKSKIRVKDFAENPYVWTEEQQDKDLLKLLRNNAYYLRNTKYFKGYHYYLGKTINGAIITKSGVLAASHLVGNKNVKKFFKTNGEEDPADANGVKCSDYMKHFADYEIPIN